MNAIFQLLNPNNTVSVNRPLAHAIGLNEAVVYGALISKFYWYSDHGMLDDGWFYSTAPDLQESTALSEKQQKRCVDNLVRAGLILCELRGMPAKRSFYIIEDVDLIQNLISLGENTMNEIKPAAAKNYDKKRNSAKSIPTETTQKMNNFLSAAFGGNCSEVAQTVLETVNENAHENSEIPHNKATSLCSNKTVEQENPKSKTLLRQKVRASSDKKSEQHFNKTKDNKPKGNNHINQSILQDYETENSDFCDRIDGIDFSNSADFADEWESYGEILRENIEYDILVENKSNCDEINELLEIMQDVVCSNKSTIRVNGEDKPQSVVKSQFLKLDSSHIEYVLESMKRNTSAVRNIRSYLITALYNAPATISSYWQSRVNHDFPEYCRR